MFALWEYCRKKSPVLLPQRRVLRSAPEKLRNRTPVSANVTQSSPGTRVNRYIGRLIEARQTESDTTDLHFLTLMYKCSERERRVSCFITNTISQCQFSHQIVEQRKFKFTSHNGKVKHTPPFLNLISIFYTCSVCLIYNTDLQIFILMRKEQ